MSDAPYQRKRKKTKIKVKKLEEKDVSYIAKKLAQNHHKLKEVELNSKKLDAKDIKELADSIEGNDKVRKFYFNNCGLDDTSVPYLETIIKKSQLYILEIEGNTFKPESVEKIVKAVLESRTICVLKVLGLNESQYEKLKLHLKINKKNLKKRKTVVRHDGPPNLENEKKKEDEERKKKEDEKKKKEDEDRKKKEDEDRKKKEDEKRRKEEEDRKRKEDEDRKKKEDEKRRKEEEDRKRKEDEDRKRKEDEKKKKEEEDRKRKEEEKKKRTSVKVTPSKVSEYIEQVKKNSITELSLSKKQIEDNDLKLLCDTLKTNKTVKKLDLQDNKITDKGIDYLIDLLKVNSAIETLELEGNTLGHSSVRKVIDGIKNNKSLTDLTVSEFATDEDLDEIDDILDRNFDAKEEAREKEEKKKKEEEEKKKKEAEKKMAEEQRKKAEEERKKQEDTLKVQEKPGRRKSILLGKAAQFGYKPKAKANITLKNLVTQQKEKEKPVEKKPVPQRKKTNPFLKQIQKEKDSKKSSGGGGNSKLHHLLRWANLIGYDYDVEVNDFTSSWKDGKMFAAIVNYHDESLMEYPKDFKNPQEIIKKAFDCLEEMGVEPVLDPLDAGLEKKSMMLYLSLIRDQMKAKYGS